LQAHATQSQRELIGFLATQAADYRPLYIINAVVVKGADLSLVNSLAARGDVDYLMANHRIPIEHQATDDLASGLQEVTAVEWNIMRVNADDVWAMGYTGQGVVVAEIDSGTQWDHPALQDHYRGWDGAVADHNYNWYDPYFQSPGGGTIPGDVDGHGTHVMGTMVGDDGAANQIGMAPGAQWISCKGGDNASGYLLTNELLICAEWIVAPWDLNGDNPDPAMRPHVVNNSWGGGPNDYWYTGAISAWRAAGIFPAFANGNAGPLCSTAHSPGDNWNAFAAGATDNTNAIAGFSSRGPAQYTGILKPDISAPGVAVRSSVPTNAYASYGGTSMASPHIAGALALLWSADPELIGQVDLSGWILQQNAMKLYTDQGCGGDLPDSWPNNTFGYGLLDIQAAVNAALGAEDTLSWLTVEPSGGTLMPGMPATEVSVTFNAPATGGVYTGTLWLVADDPYNHDLRLPVELTVFAPPVAGFTSNSPVPTDGTAVFTNTTTGSEPLSYEWDFGDGMTSTLTSPTHTYTVPGTYTVTLYASNEFGEDSVSQAVEQLGIPIASFVSTSPDLLGETTAFTDTTLANPPATLWLWQFGDDLGTSTDQNPMYEYGAAGLYSVTLYAMNAEGNDTYSDWVAICSAFVSGASFTAEPAAPMAGDVVAFEGSVAAGDDFPEEPVTFAWDFGDGGIASGATVTHTFAAGSYTVTLTASGPCGTDSTSQMLEVAGEAEMFYLYLPILAKDW
jgi:PKD repeat protein